MANKFAVIGLGLFGQTIARTLAARGAEVLAIDADMEKVDLISEDVSYAVAMDATDPKAMKAHNVQDMDAVVVAIGSDFEATLLCTVLLLEMKVKRIITRSSNDTQLKILQRMGVQEIFSPEDEVGMLVANRLLNPDIVTFLSLPDEYEIAEITAPKAVISKTVAEAGLRKRFNLNLITIQRSYEEIEGEEVTAKSHLIGVPKADTVIFANDTLILMGKRNHIRKFLEAYS
ncbi:MAG: TrkA family potassium uptake protein [Bacteroidia bacterium]